MCEEFMAFLHRMTEQRVEYDIIYIFVYFRAPKILCCHGIINLKRINKFSCDQHTIYNDAF